MIDRIYLEKLLEINPYSIKKQEKERTFLEIIKKLTEYHYHNCDNYRKILDHFRYNVNEIEKIEDVPFLPARLFKIFDFISVDRRDIVKILNSSGTTGQPSKIYLDSITAVNQARVLYKIISDVIGKKRLPMLIIDSENAIRNKELISARGAGILGFSVFGKERTFALNNNMEVEINVVEEFLKKHQEEEILIFGFTSFIWKYLYKEVILKKGTGNIDLSKAILIHGGGWKKLSEEKIDESTFKKILSKETGIKKIFNYYGMVEQTGSIFMECEEGKLHCSIFSDIVIRDNKLEVCDKKEVGLIEVLSILPHSYPGHAILSEDLGEMLGEDDCPCGRFGKYFKVHGRIKEAEIRGCSDTYG